MLSLNARLTLSASVVLVAFLGLTGLALERAFRQAGLAAVQDRLQGQIYTLLAAAELASDGTLVMPSALPDTRLSSADAGLYARVIDDRGEALWRSPSLLGSRIDFPSPVADGVAAFTPATDADGRGLYALSFAVHWEIAPGGGRRLTFQVAESEAILARQLEHFQRSLWGWLGGAALALLLVQGLVLRFGLAPLRRVATELAEIESGDRGRLSGDYPRELGALTERLNGFIAGGQARLERSRNALAELAHSLKTPLAVLRGLLDGDPDPGALRAALNEQTESMHRTIDYQLHRAATSGPTPLAPPVDIAPLARRLRDSLAKVYASKGLHLGLDIATGTGFHGDAGDLTEVLGNLLDNACKWAKRQVRLRVAPSEGQAGLMLEVEDDGPGIPEERADAVLGRGVRADARTPGHGIGLAVVRDIVVDAYGGEVRIATADLGGARVTVRIPAPAAGEAPATSRGPRSPARPA